ncbi:hypothetical protein LTR85_007589 [Meristemomyces frigidus]|nr:hypothetical protein LTR85_007589 [Meristemomyces frigidus]
MASNFESKLPPEIRLEIYRFALHFDKPLVHATEPQLPLQQLSPATPAALLAVNRKIHEEAVDVFYEQNTFSFPHAAVCKHARNTNLEAWTRLLAHAYRSLIIVIDERRHCHPLHCFEDILEELSDAKVMPKLRTVTVSCKWLVNANARRICNYFRGLGCIVTFTGVGRYHVVGAAYPDTAAHDQLWRFEYPALLDVWSRLANLDPNSFEPPRLRGSGSRLIHEVQSVLYGFYNKAREKKASLSG